jgi:SAM-dependent methyltransferase
MPEAVVGCPVCGGREFTPVEPFADERIETTYAACAGCGLVAMNPRPTAAELGAFYRDTYWDEWGVGNLDAKKAKQARRAEDIVRLVSRALPAAGVPGLAACPAILEIGSSFGRTLGRIGEAVLAAGGRPSLHAIEPNETAVRAGTDVYESAAVIGRDLHDLRAYEGRFDLVILSHVLEHLPDPVAGLALIRDRLAPAGVVYVEVPNYYGHPSVEFAHNYCFTPVSLRNTLARAGLRAVEFEITGHRENFPFYLCTLAARDPDSHPAFEREAVGAVRDARAAARAAFARFRERNPRPV